MHLAIFAAPVLDEVLRGEKRVDSRFSVRRSAPFRKVEPGDVILLKAAGGPVLGVCVVGQTWFVDLVPGAVDEIRRELGPRMGTTDDAFWRACAGASHASLLEVASVRRVPPMTCPKRDRRGWVVLLDRAAGAPLARAVAPYRDRPSRSDTSTW